MAKMLLDSSNSLVVVYGRSETNGVPDVGLVSVAVARSAFDASKAAQQLSATQDEVVDLGGLSYVKMLSNHLATDDQALIDKIRQVLASKGSHGRFNFGEFEVIDIEEFDRRFPDQLTANKATAESYERANYEPFAALEKMGAAVPALEGYFKQATVALKAQITKAENYVTNTNNLTLEQKIEAKNKVKQLRQRLNDFQHQRFDIEDAYTRAILSLDISKLDAFKETMPKLIEVAQGVISEYERVINANAVSSEQSASANPVAAESPAPVADAAPAAPEQKKNRYATFREDTANRLIRAMEEGVLPWRSFHGGDFARKKAKRFFPFNGITGRPYHGGNAMNLRLAAMERGTDDPRWMTFNQISKAGYKVRKGAKSELVEFWDFDKVKDWKIKTAQAVNEGRSKESIEEEFGKEPYPVSKCFAVFNGSDVEGLEPLPEIESMSPTVCNVIVEKAIQEIQLAGGYHALATCRVPKYLPQSDAINMPDAQLFKSDDEYYATALHELIHATGHESRTDRFALKKNFETPDEAYAFEELCAEFSAAALCEIIGIESDFKNHASYIESWIKSLKNDKNYLFMAARAADAGMNYIIERVPELQERLETLYSMEADVATHDDASEIVQSVQAPDEPKVVADTDAVTDVIIDTRVNSAPVEVESVAAPVALPDGHDLAGVTPVIAVINTPENPITVDLNELVSPEASADPLPEPVAAPVDQLVSDYTDQADLQVEFFGIEPIATESAMTADKPDAAPVVEAQSAGNSEPAQSGHIAETETSSTVINSRSDGIKALEAVAHYIPVAQRAFVRSAIKQGEEWRFFAEKMVEIKQIIDQMPSYNQAANQADDAVVYLHYFGGSTDSYVLSRDRYAGEEGAFPEDYDSSLGYQDIGYGAEKGSVSVKEICSSSHIELDFHFAPCSLKELKIKRNEYIEPAPEQDDDDFEFGADGLIEQPEQQEASTQAVTAPDTSRYAVDDDDDDFEFGAEGVVGGVDSSPSAGM